MHHSGPPPLGPNLAIVDEESGQLIDIDGSTVGEGKTVRIACFDNLKLNRVGEYRKTFITFLQSANTVLLIKVYDINFNRLIKN